MVKFLKILLIVVVAHSFAPAAFAASGSSQELLKLAHITKKVKKPKKKPKKKSVTYGATKTLVKMKKKYKPGTIIIKTSERKLYYVTSHGKAIRYSIAVGSTAGRQWKGKSFISRKRPKPTWIPTASMIRKNPKMPRVYKPGPRNPLGVRAMNLGGTPLLRIHGTNAPWSIGKAASHGCYRMRNVDVLDLYKRVKVGTKVIIL